MNRFLVHWLTMTLALWVTAWILPGVTVHTPSALLIAAVVLGLLNALVKPFLLLLTLPLTILTLGLFYFVLNGIVFALGSKLVPGFEVAGFGWALLGAIVMSLVATLIGRATGREQI